MICVQVPLPCPFCRGSGARITVPVLCPRSWEARYLNLAECRFCGGDGLASRAEESDAELVRAWDDGGGFRVPLELREAP